MSFFDDWGWLGDVAGDIGDTVSDWFGGDVGDALKTAGDVLDLYEPKAREEVIGYNPVTGAPITKKIDQGWNVGNILGLGADIYGQYGDKKLAEQAIARMQPLQDYYSKVIPQMEAYYDPATARRGIRQEYERRKGMLTPYWEEGDLARHAKAKAAGRTGSSTYGKQLAQREAERAKILSGTVLPAAEAAYYSKPQQLMDQATRVTGLMTGQPIMQKDYQQMQRATDPWGLMFSEYLKNI